MHYNSNPIIKTCEYCGNEFESHHGLQRYCPEKFGRINYCKNEQKKLINERKLADLVQDVAGAVNQIENQQNQLEINIQILNEIIGNKESVVVSGKKMDSMGYDIRYYSARRINEENGLIELVVGPFILEWIDNSDIEQTFKISKI